MEQDFFDSFEQCADPDQKRQLKISGVYKTTSSICNKTSIQYFSQKVLIIYNLQDPKYDFGEKSWKSD